MTIMRISDLTRQKSYLTNDNVDALKLNYVLLTYFFIFLIFWQLVLLLFLIYFFLYIIFHQFQACSFSPLRFFLVLLLPVRTSTPVSRAEAVAVVADMAVAVVCEDPMAGGAEQHDSAVLMRITPRPFRQPIRSRHLK